MEGAEAKNEGSKEADSQAHKPDKKTSAGDSEPTHDEPANQGSGDEVKKRWWRDKRWHNPQVIVNGALAIIGIAAACIYYGQLCQMKIATRAAADAAERANDAITQARESAHLDQRAWVAATEISGTPKVGNPFQVKVVASNTGKTFAKNFRMVAYIENIPLNFPFPVDPTFRKDEEGWEKASVNLLAPNARKKVTYDVLGGTPDNPSKVTKELVEQWRSPTRPSTYFISGKMKYDDIFGCHHWSTFCAFLSDELEWAYYQKHNDADNECGPKIRIEK